MSTKLTVHAYDWTTEDKYTVDERLAIHVWCLDRESNPYLLRIEDFPVFCHVELPLFVNGKPFNWANHYATEIFEWLKRALHDHAPERFRFEMAPKLYYYRRGRKYPFMLLTFKSIEAMRHAEYFLAKAHRIEGFGTLAFNVWETNITPVRKLLTQVNMQYSQWFEVEAELIPDADRVSTLDREYLIKKWRSIHPISGELTKSWSTKPRIVSIDIETYSHKIHAMPSKFNALDIVNVISVIYQRSGDVSSRKRYGLVLGECNDISASPSAGEKLESASGNKDREPYATILKYNNEVDLINGMSKLIIELDPEVIIGYNILGFDYPYLDHRLKRKMKEWLPMGRLRNKIPKMTTLEWQSSAFSFNSINMIHMDGRISIDIYPLIKRDNKFEEYGLGFVSQQFLGRTKHDVKAEEQFLIYREYREAKEKYETYLGKDKPEESKAKEIVDQEKLEALKVAYQKSIEKMTKFVAYCIQDSDLVIDLFEHNKMKYWISLIEMSNIMGVTITDLFLRGQQVRCMSLFYNIATQKGIIIDKREQPIVKFSGGFVYEPDPGCHENILCFDFASLYPSIIQAYNICLSTLVDPTIVKEIPDENCHVFDFDQEEDDEDDEKDLLDTDKKKESTAKKHYHYKFVKREIQEGLLPQLERTMVAERAAINAQLKGKKDKVTGAWIVEPEKDPLIQTVLDKRQLAIKQTCNSFFGFLGVQEGGKLPLIEGAMCITAKGRELINQVNVYLQDKYKARIVYNDSVTAETPVLIQYDNVALYERIDSIIPFEDYPSDKNTLFDEPRYYTTIHREDGKDEVILDNIVVNVWSDQGWTRIKRIIRHETTKAIYRIITVKGYVDVTEDHSLIRENGQLCSPTTVKIGDSLLTAKLPSISLFNVMDEDSIDDTLIGEAIKYYQYSKNCAHPYINARDRVASAYSDKLDSRIITIKYLTNARQYVYDFETENHHFAAGVGELIVHNTDSSMVDLGITDPHECNARGEHLAAEISALFPPPLRIEFEKAMRLLCFKKKKYAAVLIDKNGNHMFEDKDILKRGIVLARRDNCKWVRTVYMQILKCILTKKPLEDSMDILIENVSKLINNQIAYKELIFTRELGANYKSENYFMKVYADELRRKGQIVNPGDRLQFLIVKSEDKGLLGLRMCRPDMYIESLETKTPYVLDHLYYMEHALMNPIDQLISVGYKKEFTALPQLGYKPNGRYKFRPINEPVEMMIRMLIDGNDVHKVKNMLKPIVHKGPHLNIITPLKNTNEINVNSGKKSRLRIIPKSPSSIKTLQ